MSANGKITGNGYSASFSEERGIWTANIKMADGAWRTKTLPKALNLSRTDTFEAERWIHAFREEFVLHGRASANPKASAKRSIKVYAETWLKFRDDSRDTSEKTFQGFRDSMRCHILDNPEHPHRSIQDLDIVDELNVREIAAWIESLPGAPSTKLQQIGTLKRFIDDAIMCEWDRGFAELINPLTKKLIKKMVKELNQQVSDSRVIAFLSLEQLSGYFASPAPSDMRKVQTLFTVLTGHRLEEVQGHTWQDVDFEHGTVSVRHQLLRFGVLPLVSFPELRAKMSKEAIYALPNAIIKAPKKKSRRTTPMHPLLSEVLRYWRETGWKEFVGRDPLPGDPVFPQGSSRLQPGKVAGQFRNDTHAGAQLRVDLAAAGQATEFVPGHAFNFHSLRKTFAHLAARAGGSDAMISALLGHGAGSTAAVHYYSPEMEARRAVVEAFSLPEVIELRGKSLRPKKPALGVLLPFERRSVNALSDPKRSGPEVRLPEIS